MSASLETITLSSSLNHDECARLAAELARCQGTALAVDASGVQQVTARCIQLLLIGQQQWARSALPFQIVDPSERFEQAARELGLHQHLFSERSPA